MYAASAPAFLQVLTAFEGVLDKAIAFAEAKKIDHSVIAGLRLAPDMLPFSRQIQFVADYAVRGMARLANTEPPEFANDEKTLEELKARLAKAIAYVKGVAPAALDGVENREVTFGVGGGKTMTVPAPRYFFQFALPNFYFHATTAYAILRSNGVEIGKRDFIGAF